MIGSMMGRLEFQCLASFLWVATQQHSCQLLYTSRFLSWTCSLDIVTSIYSWCYRKESSVRQGKMHELHALHALLLTWFTMPRMTMSGFQRLPIKRKSSTRPGGSGSASIREDFWKEYCYLTALTRNYPE